jgi:DNA-binding NtrC family response regulator
MTPHVLFVTDDRDLREAAQRALAAIGYNVRTAGHAGHALLACLDGGAIDVVVAEMSMRDTSGPALARRLRRHRPDLPVVYVAKPGTPERDGVLVRPLTRDALVREIELAISRTAAVVSVGN